MKINFDYHTHTVFSHGTGTIEDNVKAAQKRGLKGLAISEHGCDHVMYGVKRKDVPVMRKEVDRLKPLYPDMTLLLGIEANIIDHSGRLSMTKEEQENYDIIIAGYHFGSIGSNPFSAGYIHYKNWTESKKGTPSPKMIKRNTELVIQALHKNDIIILTHPGAKGAIDVREVAKACAETNTYMEISNNYGKLSVEDIKIAAKEPVKFVINSDAHQPDRVGGFEKALKRAEEAGLDLDRIINLEK